MPLEVPTGWPAVVAWRAQTSDARQQVAVAARAARPVSAPELAAVASGYAMTVNLWCSTAVPVINVIMTVLMVYGWTTVEGSFFVGPMRSLLFGWLAVVLFLRFNGLRLQKVVETQLPLVEQTQIQAAMAAPWSPADLTGMPDGGAEIVLSRGRLFGQLLRLAVTLGLFAGLLAVVLCLPPVLPGNLRMWTLFLLAIGAVQLVRLGSFLLFCGPYLFDPVLLRLRPDGWECPATGVRGTWDEVSAVTVQPMEFTRRLSVDVERMVALRVTDPAGLLAGSRGPRHWFAAYAMRRSGSPACINAMPTVTVPVVVLVAAIRQVTDVPVRWVPLPAPSARTAA